MPKQSAGLLLFRRRAGALEVLLVHPGGPFWAKRDLGAWSIPKGELDAGEDPLAAARRELEEETGLRAAGPFFALGAVRQRGGKQVSAWAAPGEFDPAALRSVEFEIEGPPRSGKRRRFPEVDRAAWFGLDEARRRILPAQAPLLDRLAVLVQSDGAA
jgi:predicted NUDIX family NTP pyrophosphohydrolase